MTHRVDVFYEDAAHEAFARAMIDRCAREDGVAVTVNVPTSRFGVPRLTSELRAFQAILRRSSGTPDVLVVMVDANDVGTAKRRREVEEVLDSSLFPHVVIATPDPYVERWFLADPEAFQELYGIQPEIGSVRDRNEWKSRLTLVLEAAGEVVVQGGAEFAADIVDGMDLYQAGQACPSLRAFVDEMRGVLRRIAARDESG